ncbi:hypothetical protein K5X82_11450 [Halosquirtibacter xylanolyticus]|uniref:clostripain-related cysteine peptidase n=1 Tax=Halosquirtibacter xylanolyticus TaxID=3374599 RepID=UPI003748FD56|nr:hypothetical protein K5X82_11450 [Prolixibacteraceae bacterium]
MARTPNIYLLLSILFFILFSGCQKDNNVITQPQTDETLIVYMAADNNLRDYAIQNSYGIIEGLKRGQRVIVFLDNGEDQSYLFQLDDPTSKSIYQNKVKTYPNRNSGTPSVLYGVLNDIIQRYPSTNYDLILWSHGTSWLPSNRVQTKSFGLDHTSSIDIHELAMALPVKFRSIIFDACLMGSVEVISQLKDKADYIVASPTDILAEGLPYSEITPILLDKKRPIEERLEKVCDAFYSFYNNMKNPSKRSASIALYDTKQITKLQNDFKRVIGAQPQVHVLNQSIINLNLKYPCFDFMDMVKQYYGDKSYNDLKAPLQKLVLYSKHTNHFSGTINLEGICGINCYVPMYKNHIQEYYYKTLQWDIHTNYHKAIFPYVQ